MKYVRPDIRRYWVYEHKKALGLTFLVFAISYSISLSFFLIVNSYFMESAYTIFLFSMAVFILGALVVVASFVNAHTKVVRLMTEKEHKTHSKHVGLFLIIFIIGFLLCILPLIFFVYPGALSFLLSIGGLLLLFYILSALVFNYKYYEIGFASIFIWAAFVITSFLVAPLYFSNQPLFEVISFLVTSVVLITVFGISGIILLHTSANELLKGMNLSKVR